MKSIKISKEEMLLIERAARRRVYIENGSLHFKGGAHKNKKKTRSKRGCRGRAHQDGWE